MDGARHGVPSSGMLGGAISSPRSMSMASISSEGSMESPLVEQEEIAALTHDVRNLKEALGKLRKLCHSEWADLDKVDTLHLAVHERLGDVLRILRMVLERYPALQSSELLLTTGTLIQQVKGYNCDGEQLDQKEFFESIDQLALAFSSRVSEYLMGDLETNISLSSSMSSKTKSCENLASDAECGGAVTEEKKPGNLSPQQVDGMLLLLEQGVDFALHHAKLWSKYAKDVMMYVEKRAHIEMEYTKNLSKLAMTVRPLINEECHLPLQSIYCTALDHDVEGSCANQITCSLLLGRKFIEPLNARRIEHEKVRKQVKELWCAEVAQMQNFATQLHAARSTYIKCQQEWEQVYEESQKCDTSVQGKPEKRKATADDVIQKALEAEAAYKASVAEANEFHAHMQKVKSVILQRVRELILQSDFILKTVTVTYFQLQHTLCAPLPTQFQTLCASSQLYDPGTQYAEFVKRLPNSLSAHKEPSQLPFSFEPYTKGITKLLDQERKSTDSVDSEDSFRGKGKFGAKAMAGSDTDSIASSQSTKSHELSPTTNRKLLGISSCDELSANDNDNNFLTFGSGQRNCISKAAETHTFRKLKTPSRCRECDSYVYFQGCDCAECGLACHKKCLQTLAIQCGHKRLPRKMTTFGVDLGQHLIETAALVPHIICKCIDEIDSRGRLIKGIYRVSGVKSKVEKLCQAFENGAELVDLTDTHPNVIANVLKLYLRQLPEPLLTFCLYTEFVRIAKENPSNSPAELATATEELKVLVCKLPRHHFLTLVTLMQHLQRVARDADINYMPPSNLGIVFGPTLLRTAEGSASLSSLVDTVHQTRAIELMIANAQDIFGPQEIASAQDCACAEIEFSMRHSESKKIGPSDSIEGSHDAGEEMASDDELPYFLLTANVTGTKCIPREAMPKVFKGSLKDYRGLEGLSLLANQGAGSENAETPDKPGKSAAVEPEEKATKGRECDQADVQHWTAHNPAQLSTQHTESSADSDYSFESHASSSVESRSPRDLEEGCDVFLELPLWCKRNSNSAMGTTDCPSSSASRYPDDTTDSSELPSVMHTTGSTAGSTGDHSIHIPAHQSYNVSMLAAMHSIEMQPDVSTLVNYGERTDMEVVCSNRTSCYQTEQITAVKYPDLELAPMDERKVMSIEMSRKVTTPFSRLGTFHFSKTSSVSSTTECPLRTEHTVMACVQDVGSDKNQSQ